MTATLEIESFLPHHNTVSQVGEEEDLPVAATTGGKRQPQSQPSLLRAIELLGERVGKLESKIESTAGQQRDAHRQSANNNRPPIRCRKCGQEGHYARGCAAGRRGDQGN